MYIGIRVARCVYLRFLIGEGGGRKKCNAWVVIESEKCGVGSRDLIYAMYKSVSKCT